MTHGNRPSFLTSSENIQYLLGKHEIFFIDPKNKDSYLAKLLKEDYSTFSNSENIILAFRLNPLRELQAKVLGIFLKTKTFPKSMKRLLYDLNSLGLNAICKVAAFPNFRSARFYLPFDDHYSHRLLINNILVPRRYSLSFLLRIFIHIYNLILMMTTDSSFLFRYVYILVEKHEKPYSRSREFIR